MAKRNPGKVEARASRRKLTAQRRKLMKDAEAALKERKDEELAPSIQRNPVKAPDGSIVRSETVVKEGITFIRSNPIRHLVARWKAREAQDGVKPLITRRHLAACDLLNQAWIEGGQTIGIGASDYERMMQSRSSSPPDFSEKMLAKLAHQRQQRAVFEGAMTWLGALSTVIRRVAIDGVDLSVWAAETEMHRNVAPGYLCAALDRLAEFFDAISEEPKRAPKTFIRTAFFEETIASKQ